MSTQDCELPVPLVSPQATQPKAPPLQRPGLFAISMAGASLVAVGAGLVLGILAATQSWVGAERWTQSVQAHGRLQLFGFAAPLIVALALEFIPRVNGRPQFRVITRALLPAALAAAALLLAASQVWNSDVGFLVWPGVVLLAGGTVVFAAAVWSVPRRLPLSLDAQPLFLRVAAAWFVVASAFSAWGIVRAEDGVIPLDYSRAAVETFLRGFVMLMILGIALRAFVGHLGLPMLPAKKQVATLALLSGSLAAWLIGQGLGPIPEVAVLARVGDAVYALSLLLFTYWFGVLKPLRRPSLNPRYGLLIPVAWVSAVVYAALLFATAASGWDADLYEEGALRHVFVLGFMLPLMVAMAHIVLARFAVGFVPWERALTASFVFLVVAWPLRVVPALIGEATSAAGEGLLGLAGVLTMVGLALLALVCARTALLAARRERAMVAKHRAAGALGGAAAHRAAR